MRRTPCRALGVIRCAPMVLLGGQSPRPVASNPTIPRAPDGHPDLQGMWTNVTITRLERPAEFKGHAEVSEAEAAAYAKQYLKATDKDRRDGGTRADVERAYNAFFWDSGTELAVVNGRRRTSLIVDPPDGLIPPLTADAQRRIGDPR